MLPINVFFDNEEFLFTWLVRKNSKKIQLIRNIFFTDINFKGTKFFVWPITWLKIWHLVAAKYRHTAFELDLFPSFRTITMKYEFFNLKFLKFTYYYIILWSNILFLSTKLR